MKDQAFDVCIVGGLGHVGLPLGITFAERGRRVVLFDIDRKAAETISSGKCPSWKKALRRYSRRSWEKIFASPRTDR